MAARVHPPGRKGARARRARRRRPSQQPTRELILDAAERLFAKHGLDGVAVRDLARGRISRRRASTITSSKEALYEAVLERGFRPIVEMTAEAWQSGGPLRPESVRAQIDQMVARTSPSTATWRRCCSA